MANKLVDFDFGDILYQGKSILAMDESQLRNLRKNIVYIFQNSNLLENKTVYYHLSLVYKLNKQKVDEAEIDRILDFMEISRLKNSYCRALSGGQKQKVAISLALLQKPKLLLCDEISSSLDAKSEKEIYDLLKKITENSDISVLMISHNLSVLKNFCQKILFIEDKTIKDVIYPNKSNIEYNDDYYSNVVEFLNAWFIDRK